MCSHYVSTGSLSKDTQTSHFICTTWLTSCPSHSLIEDFSVCHPAFSVPGLVDANVAGMSEFPVTPLQDSLCRRALHKPNNNKQWDQIQAPNTGNLQQYHTCLQSHLFACVRMYVLGLALAGVGISKGCPGKF